MPTKVHLVKAMVFSSSHLWMWEFNYKESWAPNWCFWTVVLEETFESPWDCKETQSVYPKGNQSWIFIGRTDVEAETPIRRPPDTKNWLIWKDPDAGKDWRQEEKGTTEDEMVGWHLPTQRTWVWVNSGSRQWTGKPGVLQSMGLQRDGHGWATELNWIFHRIYAPHLLYPVNCWGHLGCFHVLAIVNSAAMNTGLHVYFWTMFTSGYMPRTGIAGS